jgi:putative membrane protein
VSASTLTRTGRVAAAAAALALITLGAGQSSAFAADDASGVKVVNTETVQVYLGADGKLESKRVYEQLALFGHGSVDLKNPVSTDGLRNIDGFDGFKVSDKDQVVKADVDGTRRYRAVSNFDGKLPVTVTPTYKLNGKTVSPGDVVGKDGELTVTYTVKNETAVPQELTFDDGSGGTVTKTVEVPIPLVGQVTTTLPKTFSDVDSGGARPAGAGGGGLSLTYNLTLFPPMGPDTATVGYTAQVTDGVVPQAEVSMLPVDPSTSPTFKPLGDQMKGGADSGAQLVSGVSTIDANLLKLRDGAGDLVAGLLKLSDGADQLHSGLADDAAPGARKLAAGAGDAYDGSKKLSAGAGKLSAGAGRLHRGTSSALDGAIKLKSGLGQISGGLGQLSAELPAAGPGVQQLIDGLDQVSAGFGAAGQAGTLIDGLTQLNSGASDLKAGLTGQVVPGIGQSKDGVDQVRAGLNAAIQAGGTIDQLLGGLDAVLGADCGPVCQNIISTAIKPGVQQSKSDLSTAYAGLGQVSGGLQQVLAGLNGQIVPGLGQLESGSAAAKAGAQQLKAGNQQVRDGLAVLKGKLADAIAGVLQVNAGAGSAYAGSGDLAAGLGQLDSGSGDLADGAGDLADGTGDLKNGLGQLDSGAGDLADGLGDAADGSAKIADGLSTASGSAPEIVHGAGRLSKEGMAPLAAAGKETTATFGEKYAALEASAARAQTESMAIGAPDGAEGLTAYQFVVRGDDGESGRNVTRGVAAAVLLSLAGGVSLLRRRMA